MGLFKADAPDPPDYSGIAAANKEAAEVAAGVAREQLDWARQTYAQDREFQTQIYNDIFKPAMALQLKAAEEDRARYQAVYQPQEDALLADIKKLGSTEEQNRRAGQAAADVTTAFEAARRNAQANLEGFGVDPSTVRSAALDIGVRTQQAAATAGVANQERRNTENLARALRSEAINIGRGYPGQVAQSTALTQAGGAQSVQSQLAASQVGGALQGNPVAWAAQGTSANNAGNSLIGSIYGSQVNAYGIGQQAKTALTNNLFDMAGSFTGMIPLAEGGQVPEEFSPSGGAARDDVPTALTAGEYVIPRDVVLRKGTEFFDKFIDKTRNPAPKKGADGAQRTALPQGMPMPHRPDSGVMARLRAM